MSKSMSRVVGKEEMVEFVCGGLFGAVAIQDMTEAGVGRYLLSRYRGIMRWDGKELATEWLIDVKEQIDRGVPLFEAAQRATTRANTTARRERRRKAKTGIPFADSPDGATVSNDPARDDRIKRRRRRIVVKGRTMREYDPKSGKMKRCDNPSLTRKLLGMMADGYLHAINAEEYVSFFAGAESAEIAEAESVIEIGSVLSRLGDDGVDFVMAILEDEAKTWRQAARVAGIKQDRAREIMGEIVTVFGFNASMMIDAVSKKT
jgi:hypothetical protein